MEVSGTMLKSAAVGILTGGSVLATVIQNKCCPENSNTVKNEFVTSPKTDVVEVSKISNNREVSMEVLKKICEFLNCDIGDIVEFTNMEVKK